MKEDGNRNFVYVCEGHAMDIVAIEYLKELEALSSVVVYPNLKDLKKTEQEGLKMLDVPIFRCIPRGTRSLICTGAWTAVSRYMSRNSVDFLIMPEKNFSGMVRNLPFSESKGKKGCTSNFNKDGRATDKDLKTPSTVIVFGDNVCLHPYNTGGGLWRKDLIVSSLLYKYNVRQDAFLPNILICREGVCFVNGEDTGYCEFQYADTKGLNLRGDTTEGVHKIELAGCVKIVTAVQFKANKKGVLI